MIKRTKNKMKRKNNTPLSHKEWKEIQIKNDKKYEEPIKKFKSLF